MPERFFYMKKMLLPVGLIGIHDVHGSAGRLCGPTSMGPTPNRARRCTADELLISLDLVEPDYDQTLTLESRSNLDSRFDRIPTAVRRC